MSESAVESTTENPEAPAQAQPEKNEVADQTDWKAEARKWEQRAKENGAKAREFEKQQQAAMTDAERATVEAEQRGRSAATAEFGQRLAKSEIRAAAANTNADLDGVFDYLDLSRFVDDDGEPDMSAIKAFVGALPVRDDGKPRAPRPDANQGRSGAGGPKSTADSFAEFFTNNLPGR